MKKREKEYTGEEKLIYNEKALPYSMLDFWRMALSDILLNMNRGTFAEFLVRCALENAGFKSLNEYKSGIEPYDVTGPRIFPENESSESRIEVKSAASIQEDTPNEKEPLSLPENKLTFSIRKAIDWSSGDRTARRNNDMYVFAHYTATRKSDNMLDLSLWDFYVYPTFKIDENIDTKLSEQKTISLRRIHQIGIPKVNFFELYDEIIRVNIDIAKHRGLNETSEKGNA